MNAALRRLAAGMIACGALAIAASPASADVVDDYQAFLNNQMAATQKFVDDERAFLSAEHSQTQVAVDDEQAFLDRQFAATQKFFDDEQAFLVAIGCTGSCFNLQPFIDDEQRFLAQEQAALNKFIDDEQVFVAAEHSATQQFIRDEQAFMASQQAAAQKFVDDEQLFFTNREQEDVATVGELVVDDTGFDDYDSDNGGSGEFLGASTFGDLALAGTTASQQPDDATLRATQGSTCAASSRPKGMKVGRPVTMSRNADPYNEQWIYQLYKQSHSNIYTGTWQKSYTMCLRGGAHSKGGNVLSRTVTGVALKSSTPRLVGWAWDRDISDSTASAQIGISGPSASPVQLSASIAVTPRDRADGGINRDKDTPKGFPAAYDVNMAYIYWQGGSPDFEGNAGHIQWEMPQTAAFPDFEVFVQRHWFCGRLFGFMCS